MNWICVLEQAVCGTWVISLIVCTGIGISMVFRSLGGFVRETEWYQKRANRPIPRPRRPGKFGRWWEKKGEGYMILVMLSISGALIGILLYGSIVIPLGKSILNVAMGRECW